MKLYVLPVERACNASCAWCITDFRETGNKEFIEIADLERSLSLPLERIEITGGGEPLLHPKLDAIIDACAGIAPTHAYTNGALIARKRASLGKLSRLCISRAHYDDAENERIMGIRYDWHAAIAASPLPVKASLLVHLSGISTADGVERYLDFMQRSGVRDIVIRQLFEHDHPRYPRAAEFVSTAALYREIAGKPPGEGNPVLSWGAVDAEFELRNCACEMDNPVLHADGRLHRGWSDEAYDPDRQ